MRIEFLGPTGWLRKTRRASANLYELGKSPAEPEIGSQRLGMALGKVIKRMVWYPRQLTFITSDHKDRRSTGCRAQEFDPYGCDPCRWTSWARQVRLARTPSLFIQSDSDEVLGPPRVGVKTLYIEPGSPWENGYIESFNGKLRDELLNGETFDTVLEAQVDERRRPHDGDLRLVPPPALDKHLRR